MVVIIEDQLNARLTNRLAAPGAIEDNVCHVFATQILGGTLAHYPAYGVDYIRLAAAIGAYNRTEV